MKKILPDDHTDRSVATNPSEINLTDDDILDAMQHIPGYLDISTEDFRSIYHLAYGHALGRLFADVMACRLMRSVIEPLHPSMMLDIAAKKIAESSHKGLPVVDAKGCVIGMLTEKDFLKQLSAESFLELLLRMLDDAFEFSHRCHETTVSVAMTQPAVTVGQHAGFMEIIEAFRQHPGRSMPVVDSEGKLLGLLLRTDFIAVCNLKESS